MSEFEYRFVYSNGSSVSAGELEQLLPLVANASGRLEARTHWKQIPKPCGDPSACQAKGCAGYCDQPVTRRLRA